MELKIVAGGNPKKEKGNHNCEGSSSNGWQGPAVESSTEMPGLLLRRSEILHSEGFGAVDKFAAILPEINLVETFVYRGLVTLSSFEVE